MDVILRGAMPEDLQSLLQAYYRRTFPQMAAAQVSRVTGINAGWESDVYTFHLVPDSGEGEAGQELVLRLYQGSQGPFKAQAEFSGMQHLYQAGYPVPQVFFMEIEQSPFGRAFMVMEKIDGVMLWPVLFSDPEPQRTARLEHFCGLMAKLHRLDWRRVVPEVPGYDGDPFFFVNRELGRWRSFLEPYPAEGFKAAMRWLEERTPQVPCLRPGPVHWDLHPANVLLTRDEGMVVIDWTQVDVTDTRFDLAWTLLLVSTQEDERWRKVILESYERQLGEKVKQIEIFEAAACAKRLASVVLSLAAGPESMGMREGAQESMLGMLPAMRKVYALLREITGLRIPEVERMLEI
jgi:aminoglycoside phosphotransferase (APT) family kinase protein